MFDAQYLHRNQIVWTPWLQREGDYMEIAAQLIQENGTGSELKVTGYTKTAEADGHGAVLASTPLTITGTGTGQATFSGLQSLVRFKIQNTSTDTSAYILFRILPVSWYDRVKV